MLPHISNIIKMKKNSKWSFIIQDLSKELLKQRLDKLIPTLLSKGLGSWDGATPTAFSRNQVQKWIESGYLSLNQKLQLDSKKLLKIGDHLELNLPKPTELELSPEDRPIHILYQDKDIVVVNKPPGLTVHPSETQKEGTLVHALLHHIKDLSGIGGKLRPGIVHRIDKDTSGALLITKNDNAHVVMSETFSKHDIDRTYWAICYGSPKWDKKTIETKIGRNPNDRKKMAIDVKNGKTAITHFRVLKRFGPFASLIEAKLETGRTHQVRVHLTHLQHSIMGDPVYGKPSSQNTKWKQLPEEIKNCVVKLPGQALHAKTLGFKHPITNQNLSFSAEPFTEFNSLLDSLKKYA